jgi:membrane-associated phospholipid phosphatase
MQQMKFLVLIIFLSTSELGAQTIILNDSTQVEVAAVKKNRVLKSVAVPTLLMATGTYLALDDHIRFEVREERNKRYPNFHNSIDNVLFAVPAATVYALNFAGDKGKNDFVNSSLLLVKSQLLTAMLTFPLKELVHERRPDDTDYKAFPSGHTSHAFAAATFMAKEFKHKSIWYGVGAYTVATSVGVLRILNNRHWISDVFAGAGIGILSTNIVYLTHQHRWGKKNNLTVIPTYSQGPGIYICYSFR